MNRLTGQQQHLAFMVSVEVGARLLEVLGMLTSPDTFDSSYKPFCTLLRERRPYEPGNWLPEAEQSGIKVLRNFAARLRRNYDAVKAALSYEWSRGQVEGQINYLKFVNRQMYGRAKPVTLASSWGTAGCLRYSFTQVAAELLRSKVDTQELLLSFAWWYCQEAGSWLLALGLALNLLVIATNGGLMPISPHMVAKLAPSTPGSWAASSRL
jgi:hypothetical protein